MLAEKLDKLFHSYINDTNKRYYKSKFDLLKLAMLATMAGKSWPVFRRHIEKDLDELSHSLHQIFEQSVHLLQVPASLAMHLRLPAWKLFVKAVDYALDTMDRFVQDMEKLEGVNEGLLGRFMSDGITGEMLRRIVVDLVVAAGDTVSFSVYILLIIIAHTCNNVYNYNVLLSDSLLDAVVTVPDGELSRLPG